MNKRGAASFQKRSPGIEAQADNGLLYNSGGSGLSVETTTIAREQHMEAKRMRARRKTKEEALNVKWAPSSSNIASFPPLASPHAA